MSKQTTPSHIDLLAEVLKKLSKKDKVKPEDASLAIQQYNAMAQELSYYKDEFDKLKNGRTEQRLELIIKKNQEHIDRLKGEVEELKKRLSSVMGQQIKEGNPDIADLSDQYRPTKLAEKFKSLYDDEWTSAFEEMEKSGEIKDEEALIDTLTKIVKVADKFCETASSQHIDNMVAILKHDICNPKVTMDDNALCSSDGYVMDEHQESKMKKMLIEIRKEFSELSVRPLGKIFHGSQLKKLLTAQKLQETLPKMNAFVGKLVSIIWMMKVQDPPIRLEWQTQGETIKKDKFTFYTKRGDVVAYCVWPAVFLHDDGPLMSKGVLQAK